MARALRFPAALIGARSPAPPARSGLEAVAAALCDVTKQDTGSHNNTWTGSSKRDCYYGGGGHDVLTGRGAVDRLFGQTGPDDLYSSGDGKKDTISGGSGNDQCWIDAGENPVSCTPQH